jgi:hypothetical protein
MQAFRARTRNRQSGIIMRDNCIASCSHSLDGIPIISRKWAASFVDFGRMTDSREEWAADGQAKLFSNFSNCLSFWHGQRNHLKKIDLQQSWAEYYDFNLISGNSDLTEEFGDLIWSTSLSWRKKCVAIRLLLVR